ncbi:MAG: hypothetical protein ACRCV7_00330 [Culicoidibacterales bacterium]
MFCYFMFFVSVYQNVFLDKYSFLEYNFRNIRKYLKIIFFLKDPFFTVLLLLLLHHFQIVNLFSGYIFLKYLLLILKVDLGSLALVQRKEFLFYGNKNHLINFMLGSTIFSFCFKSNIILDIIILLVLGEVPIIIFILITVLIYILTLCYYYYVYSQENRINFFLVSINYIFGICGIVFFTTFVFHVLYSLIQIFMMKTFDVLVTTFNAFLVESKKFLTVEILLGVFFFFFFILVLSLLKLAHYEKRRNQFFRHLRYFKSMEAKAIIANFSFAKFKILYAFFLDRSFYVFLTLLFLFHVNNIRLNQMGIFYLFLYVLNLDISSTVQTKFPYIFSFILESKLLPFISQRKFRDLEKNKYQFFLRSKIFSFAMFALFLYIYYGLSFQLFFFGIITLLFIFMFYKIYFVNNLILYKHSYRTVEDFLLEFENYTLRNFFLINIFEKMLIMIFVFNFLLDLNFLINVILLALLTLVLVLVYLVMDKRIKKNIYMNFALSKNGGSYDKIFRS